MNATQFAQYIRRAKRRADGTWNGLCPAHHDTNPSLDWRDGEVKMVLQCRAGCPFEKVTAAVHLRPEDLLLSNGSPTAPPLRAGRLEVAHYDYTNDRGELVYQVVRFEPKDFRCRRPDGRGGWTWNLADTPIVPYLLHTLANAPRVYVVEGEKDCDALSARGLIATCNHGGAGKWKPEHTEALVAAGVGEIIILIDNDRPGEEHEAHSVYALLEGHRSILPPVVSLAGVPLWER